jgi:hypothetical protein
LLDGGAVFGERQVEGGAAAVALLRVGGGSSGGVVVVAEVFSAEAGAAAAVAVGEDVTALILFWCFGCVLHVVPPHWCFFVQSLRRKGVESGLSSSSFAVKGEGPAFLGRAFCCFLSTFNSSELSETKTPVLADLFLASRWLIWSRLWILGGGFLGVWGLTCDFTVVFVGFSL